MDLEGWATTHSISGFFSLTRNKKPRHKKLCSSSPNISFDSWIRKERRPFLWWEGFELLGTCLNEGLCENTVWLLSPKIYLRHTYRMFISTDTGAGRDFPHISRPALGLAQLLCNWYLVSSPGVKRHARGVAHRTPFSADVKEKVELYFYFPNRPS